MTIQVYVKTEGEARVQLAEYEVDGGRSFSVQFKELGEPVTVRPPEGEQTVASVDVMAVLQQDGA